MGKSKVIRHADRLMIGDFDEAKFWAEHAETVRKSREQADALRYVTPQPGTTLAVGPDWKGSVPTGHPAYIPRQAIADDIHGYLNHDDDGHVNFIHTTPALQGNGIGTKLLDHAGISDNAYAHQFTQDGRKFFDKRPNKGAPPPTQVEARRKSGILRQSNLNAIFRQSDMAPAFGVMPPVATELPDHDYLQHGLGDDEDWGLTRTAAENVPEIPESGAQLPDAPGPMPDDYWGGGGCGQLALAFKNMWPDLKIGADIDNKDGTINHAWVHDGKRAHDFMGTHPDPHGPSGNFPNFTHHEDMDPAHLASIYGRDGIKWSPEEPWADDTVNEAAGEIEKHWLNRHYDPDTGEYHTKQGSSRMAAPAGQLAPTQAVDYANSGLDPNTAKPAPGSSHGAEIHSDVNGGAQWLVKKAPPHAQSMVEMDVAANRIASHSGLEAPATFKMNTPEGTASAQLMYPGAKDAYPGKGKIDPESIPDDDLLTFQKHHALDWMLANHDDHNRNFIRTQDGKLVGIDKGQSMKFINNDRLAWDFFPNEHEPVHNTLYRNMAQGGRMLNDPRQGELGKYIQGLQDIPDEDYQAMLRPYAEQAAQEGKLAKDWKSAGYQPHHGGDLVMADPRMPPNDPDAFLNIATQRKNNLMNDFGKLYDRAMTHRNTGTGIA